MRLKIRDSHLTCKVANKCLNIRERVEVVEWNKRWFPPFPCCPVNCQCLWKKTLIEKKNNNNNKICVFIMMYALNTACFSWGGNVSYQKMRETEMKISLMKSVHRTLNYLIFFQMRLKCFFCEKGNSETINTIHVNIKSLSKNFDNLFDILREHNYSFNVLCITGTHKKQQCWNKTLLR